MKRTITVHSFRDAFVDCGRKDSFSYDGLGALFEYLEEFEEGSGMELELDPIGLCCEFAEYDSALACIEEGGYGFEADPDDDEEDQEEQALEYLRDNTQVIEFDGGIIIASF